MSFYEESSIVITPNAYKAGTLYAVVPTSGAADMDVTRATAATRVDESGLVNYAEVIGSNLAICGDFECASPLTGWTVNTDGAISIDNGRLKVLNVTNRGRSYRTYTGLTPGKTYEAFVSNISGNVGGFCHITSGTSNNNITLNAPFFFVAGATTAEFQCGVNSTIVDRFTFFDNISLKQNDRDNVPRIDYTGGGCPHILAEPQRENIVPYSEPTTDEGAAANITYESFSWNIGFENCVAFGDNSVIRYRYGGSVTNGTEYTLSAYVLMDDNSEPVITNNSGSGDFSLNIGNTVGIGTNNANVSMGNNIWRVSKTAVVAQTTTNNGIIKYTTQSSTGFKVVGWQLEAGSYPTSYIPTSGSTVTRNQDLFSRGGISSLIGTAGVLFVEMAALSNDLTNRSISLNDGTSSNRLLLYFSSASNQIAVVSTGFTGSINYAVSDETSFNKFAVRYKDNDVTLWVDGASRGTPITSATIPTFTALKFDSGAGASPFYGKVKQLQVYPTALSDSELTSLTTP